MTICDGSKRAYPPEDGGGPFGYQQMLETLSDSKHPERAEFIKWRRQRI